MVYGIEPAHKKIKFPKKKKEVYRHELCRSSDKHIDVIVQNSITVSNRIKEQGGSVPKGMKKSKDLINEWLLLYFPFKIIGDYYYPMQINTKYKDDIHLYQDGGDDGFFMAAMYQDMGNDL